MHRHACNFGCFSQCSSNLRCCTCTAETVLMHTMNCRPGKRCCDIWHDLHDVGCETLQKYVNKAGQAASVNEQLQIDHTPAKAFA